MISLSFCIIAKNEEKNIEKCLKPLLCTGLEIIVLDTGSTDQTIYLAKKYTDKVFHFTWINDFSAARNYAMEQATNDFVLFVDADEVLESIDLPTILKYMEEYPTAIGRLKRRNLCPNGNSTNILVDHVERLFNRRLFYYQGRIHEQVTSRNNQELQAYEIPFVLFHGGYLGTKEEIKAKSDRNNQLLFQEVNEYPDDPYLYYQLGQSFDLCEDYESSYLYYTKGYKLHPDPTLEYVKVMIVSYGYSMILTNRSEEALMLNTYYSALSTYADYICMMGDVYLHLGKPLSALYKFQHALTLQDYHVEGSNNAIPAHNLGCIYEAYGNIKAAKQYYEEAISYGYMESEEQLAALLQKETAPDVSQKKKMCLVLTCHCPEESLSSFLTSIKEQTIGMDPILLICLCDTTQKTKLSQLLQFEKENTDSVLCIQLEKEESFGSSCQIAFEYCTTEYVAFFTGKEYLHPEYCRQIMQVLQSNPVDILCYNTSENLPIHSDPQNDGKSAYYIPTDATQKKAFLLAEHMHENISTHVFSSHFLLSILPLSPTAEQSSDFEKQFLTAYQNSVSTYIWFNTTLLRYKEERDNIV